MRGKRAKLAQALDAVGVLDKFFWLSGQLGRPTLAVLTYHRVARDEEVGELDREVIDAEPDVLSEQLEVVKRLCTPITTLDLLAFRRGRPLPKNPVMFAFDDGYMDNFGTALPIFQRAGVPAVFFIPTAYPDAGKLFWWDKVSIMMRRSKVARATLRYPRSTEIEPATEPGRASEAVAALIKNDPGIDLDRLFDAIEEATGVHLSAAEEREIASRTIMGQSEILALKAAGMDVQSHSHAHRVLDTMGVEEARADLERSRVVLREMLGAAPHAVAYPVGYTLRGRYRNIAAEAGFDLGFLNSVGLCRTSELDPLAIPRIAMDRDHRGALYKLLLLLGERPHRLHDASLRNLTGEEAPVAAQLDAG